VDEADILAAFRHGADHALW